MSKKLITAGLTLLVAGSLLMAACGRTPATSTEPTIDPNSIYTEAAQTVEASMTGTAASRPNATATETVEPTNTMAPNVADALTATAGAVDQIQGTTAPGAPGADTGGSNPVVLTTATPTIQPLIQPTATQGSAAQAPAPTSGDKAELTALRPTDGVVVSPESSWDQTITFKNTGTTTWTTGYALKYWGGDRMDSPIDFYLQNEVKPGESYTFLFPMKAPSQTGDKTVVWVLQNAQGGNFSPVSLLVKVSDN